MNILEDKFIDFIRKKGLRYTPERRAMLKGIFAMSTHFDADILYDFLKENQMNLSRATIYRAIPLFIESGILRKSPCIKGREQYELMYGKDPHHHCICVSCGKIIEFKDKKLEEFREDIRAQYNFKPVNFHVCIQGFCQDCKNKSNVKK